MNESIVGKHSFASVFLAGLQGIVPALIVGASLYFAALFRGESFDDHFVAFAAIACSLALLLMQPHRYGSSRAIVDKGSLALSVLMRWGMLLAILGFIGFATRSTDHFPRSVVLGWALVTPLCLVVMEALLHDFARFLQISRGEERRAVFAGCNEVSLSLDKRLRAAPETKIEPAGFFDDRSSDRLGIAPDTTLLGKLAELPEYVRAHGIDVIFVVLPMRHIQRVIDLLDDLRDTTASIYYVPDIFVFDLIQARTGEVAGMPVVAMCETPFYGYRGVFKRLTDLLIAGVALILLSPLMLVISLMVKLTSPGSAIFRQKRYGLDGQQIIVYKFRTMKVSEDGNKVVQAQREDPRVTAVGAFLRRTSLDELPQLFNVVQGSMSLVGPRPHAVAHNEQYRKLIKGYMMRHKVRPGMTGLAQVNGCRGETAELQQMEARIRHDLEYLRSWSPVLDVQILWRTLLMIFKRDTKAY